MRKILIAAVMVLALAIPVVLQADVKVGVSLNEQGLNSFYLALSDYNKVQQQNVVAVKKQGIPDEELPVVFYMASKAKVPYAQIAALRLQKWNWSRIAMKYKLDPAIFNVTVKTPVKGKVYGGIYKIYQANPKPAWNRINLSDSDVINSVNLRLVSDYYGYSPEEVIRMREQGRDFITINNEVKAIRVKKGWHPKYEFAGARPEGEGFYTALADYSMVRPWEVNYVRQLGIPDEELPVVFFMAAGANAPYGDIANLRLKRWTWMRIAARYGLDPAMFYVPVNVRVTGGLFGRIYAFYTGLPYERWNRIQLNDQDVINFVNLRFVSDYYGYSPEEVIRLRENGRNFIAINNDVRVITVRKNWGKKDNNYREAHNAGYKYDRNYIEKNDYNWQHRDENGRDGQGFKGKGRDENNNNGQNYKDLDEKNYKKDNRDANVRDNGSQNNSQQGSNNQGWNNNNRKKNGRGGQVVNNAPVAQATATPVPAQPTAVPAQATAVPAAGQDQGNNGQDQGNRGSKDKGNNGVRNHGVGNDNGVGNQKHDNQ